jgi:nicotinamidase-related amidase
MRILLVCAVAGMAMTSAAAQGRGPAQPAPDEALVIIDIQNFYFEGGQLPLTNPVEAAAEARRVLDRYRSLHLPVIHVRHMPAKGPANDQYLIHASVTPLPGEKVIIKHYANAFRDTELLDYLKQAGIRKLVICGMQTQMCVEATARAAADLGFDVTVVADACATRPLEYGGTSVPAAQVHAAALATLKGTYAKVVTTDELLKAK